MRDNERLSWNIFLRFIVSNLMILFPALVGSVAAYVLASRTMFEVADNIARIQLERTAADLDLRFQDFEKAVTALSSDYEVNWYLNHPGDFTGSELYHTRRVSRRLASLHLGMEFLERIFIYLERSDLVVYENGFAPYDLFYTTLFEVEGYSAEMWLSLMEDVNSKELPSFFPGSYKVSGGHYVPVLFFIRPLGTGTYKRGVLVAIFNKELLARRLSPLPASYGGGVMVVDGRGTVVVSTGVPLPVDEVRGAMREGRKEIRVGGEEFKIYSHRSGFMDWHYIAVVNTKKVNAPLSSARGVWLLLVLLGCVGGVSFAYGVAFSNSRPLSRIVRRIPEGMGGSFHGLTSVYQEVEEALVHLSERTHELEVESDRKSRLFRDYFFQILLRGGYEDREIWRKDAERFGIEFLTGRYLVIAVGTSPLEFGGMGAEALDQVEVFLEQRSGEGEHCLRMPSGILAVVKHLPGGGECRREVEEWVRTSLEGLPERLSRLLLFGVGSPVEDPFLLPLSFGEAKAALEAIPPEGRTSIQFYEDLHPAPLGYWYPLDVEEALIRAARGGNRDLLVSLLSDLWRENFQERTLVGLELQNFFLALRGTMLRVVNENGPPSPEILALLEAPPRGGDEEEGIRWVTDVFTRILEMRNREKRSHNETLALQIEGYLRDHFDDPSLCLSSIAERFHLSESYLSSFFREQRGEYLSGYLLRLRMERAVDLLVSTRMPVEEVARRCGYTNVSSFRRAFKRMFGVSPHRYRDEHAGSSISQ
ncbi:transcriptional regulator, AraC family [Spirochaeta thermophila DSM 6578]|uniref:Transcriptional regulator, AraC family n=1 Tax=Winmispira thermophila (strain ATCC 700085 / DSM 6578 / Z-1203) TaxID=869211 RepID=G0GFH3_WINT7|nr:helix-turn-helix domain-containing protein [Spirochaeta thermophila]AEJ61587.1 transcriptional regulator, AraC family [Spirochaeta thermophila DSM 6578]